MVNPDSVSIPTKNKSHDCLAILYPGALVSETYSFIPHSASPGTLMITNPTWIFRWSLGPPSTSSCCTISSTPGGSAIVHEGCFQRPLIPSDPDDVTQEPTLQSDEGY
ncbi:hypothetical protein A0H81_01807 [Grifola frondosa]|uniref:Uncharacterized protein n=1 Tax=Grifola frondosa TaxID=5627 RepID=A0A1C7MMM8_GRIFR|nr:hypothetical protein A0H81_01807 [Grifola frondosa]